MGYLGPPGSHSHQAAMQFLSAFSLDGYTAASLQPYPSFYRLMEAIGREEVAIGILPVENGLEGAVIEVNETLGLNKRLLRAHAEFLIPIHHALIQAKPDGGQITHIMSHTQALGQCRETLFDLFGDAVETIPTLSTSEAVRLLSGKPPDWAAIGTATAAKIYNFSVIRDNISDTRDNQTRFLLLSSANSTFSFPHRQNYPQKTSLCLGMADRPGILAEVLWELKKYHVNLSRIESRPSRKRFGEYYFYMDIDGDIHEPLLRPLYDFLKTATTYCHETGPYACLGLL